MKRFMLCYYFDIIRNNINERYVFEILYVNAIIPFDAIVTYDDIISRSNMYKFNIIINIRLNDISHLKELLIHELLHIILDKNNLIHKIQLTEEYHNIIHNISKKIANNNCNRNELHIIEKLSRDLNISTCIIKTIDNMTSYYLKNDPLFDLIKND